MEKSTHGGDLHTKQVTCIERSKKYKYVPSVDYGAEFR